MSTGRRGEGRRRTTARPLALAAVTALLLAGCFGDPPPDPEVAPLEVVVESSKAPDEPCLLNRGEVAAGLHEVTVFAEGGEATVVIRGADGSAVLEAAVPDDSPDAVASGDEPPEGAVLGTSTSVQLEAGEYVVECAAPAGPVGTAQLRVTPARSGG